MQPPDSPPPSPPTPRRVGFSRHPDDRIVAGVCAGIARALGVEPIVVRAATLAFALAGGVGIVLYVAAWALAEEEPAQGDAEAVITQRQSLAVGLVALGLLLLLRDLGLWLGDSVAVPVTIAAIGSAVIYTRSDESDRGRWGRFAERIPGSAVIVDRSSPVRLVVGAILIVVGLFTVLATTNALLALRSVALAAITALVGVGLVFGPWVASLARDLAAERRERIRSEERAEVAAHLHDSVLQTLALIQRAAHDPRRMVALARSQERELRAWLYGGRDLAEPDTTLRGLLDDVLVQVETAHDLDVDLVVVGDVTPDGDVRALVAAVREALMNVGAHAGVSDASVYVEVEEERIAAFVRDRGAGFDPGTVSPDRRGVADSIRGRLVRHGGAATLVTAPGEGTEWELAVRLPQDGSVDSADGEASADGPTTSAPDPSWPAPQPPATHAPTEHQETA